MKALEGPRADEGCPSSIVVTEAPKPLDPRLPCNYRPTAARTPSPWVASAPSPDRSNKTVAYRHDRRNTNRVSLPFIISYREWDGRGDPHQASNAGSPSGSSSDPYDG